MPGKRNVVEQDLKETRQEKDSLALKTLWRDQWDSNYQVIPENTKCSTKPWAANNLQSNFIPQLRQHLKSFPTTRKGTIRQPFSKWHMEYSKHRITLKDVVGYCECIAVFPGINGHPSLYKVGILSVMHI